MRKPPTGGILSVAVLATVLSAILFVGLLLARILVVRKALAMSRRGDDRGGVWAGIGSGLLTGAVLALLGALLSVSLQGGVKGITEEETWRANFETSYLVPGFRAKDHDLDGLIFSGKKLTSANMVGARLEQHEFRDTDLRDARLQRAHLDRADMIGANLSQAEMRGAVLDGADLEGARFDNARVELAKSMKGAKVNSKTCWPKGFLRDPSTRHLVAQLVSQEKEGHEARKGHEAGSCAGVASLNG